MMSSRPLPRAALGLALFTAACDDATAPAGTFLELSGTITELYADTARVAGARVTAAVLTSDGEGGWAADTTGADGRYTIQIEIPGGCEGRDSVDALLRVSHPEFYPTEEGLGSGLRIACSAEPQALDERIYRIVYRTPLPVAGGLTVSAVSAGAGFACGMARDGLRCWGLARDGALGDPHGTGSVEGGESFVAVDAGWHHACALDVEGAAWCWGDNGYGQVGVPIRGRGIEPEPVRVPTDARFVEIAAGYMQSCARTAEGGVHCWGHPWAVGRSESEVEWAEPPAPVAGDIVFTRIRALGKHTCGLDAEGAAYCWGSANHGQTGAGAPESRVEYTPVRVSGIPALVDIASGGWFTCGLTVAGEVWCWGSGSRGQTGQAPGSTDAIEPIRVATGHAFVGLTAGAYHACGWDAAGQVFCWGQDAYGQLGGVGAEPCGPTAYGWTCSSTPLAVPGSSRFESVTAGLYLTSGVGVEGLAYCWGHRHAIGVEIPIWSTVADPPYG
jgi:alpha-tubulin suppressor-like RCC1 family protein